MKRSFNRLPLIIIFMAFYFLQPTLAQWEVLNPDIEIRNLTLVGKTFYGINKGKLVKSNNSGVDWYADPDFSEISIFEKYNDKFLIKGIYKNMRNLYYSKDNMETWNQCTPNVAFQEAFLNDSAIFLFSLIDPYVFSPISKSTDEGKTFQTVDFDTQGRPYQPGKDNYYCYKNEIALFIGGIGFFFSTDWGKTWKKIMTGLPMNDSNYSEYSVVNVTKTGLGYTMLTSQNYYLKNEKWEVLNSAFYRYNTYNKNYQDAGQKQLLITAYKDPFYAGISLSSPIAYSGELYLSTDKGKTCIFLLIYYKDRGAEKY